MNQTSANPAVPDPILRKLQLVRKRKMAVQIACAVAAALAVLLAAMGIAMLIDWLATLYDSRWRVVLTTAAIAAAVLTTAGWIFVAWRRLLGLERVALDVDREIPQLEERWTTMTRLGADADDPNVIHPAMLRRVATEATSWEPHVEPTEVVSVSPLVKSLVAVTAVTAVLAVAVVLDTRQTLVLVRRFWAPASSISATQLVDVPGNIVVGRGEPVALGAKIEGTPVEQATLFLQSTDEPDRAVTLVAASGEKLEFSHRMRSVEAPFAYRFRAGDGQTDWYRVDVADRPEIARVKVTVTPPAYTRRPAETFDHLPRRISAMQKSQFEIALRATMPVERAELEVTPDKRLPLVADRDGWLRWSATLEEGFSFTPRLTESHGLTNRRAPKCDLVVYLDKPPAVKVLTPDDQMAVRPEDTVQITFSATDDVGIGSAELLVYENKPDGEPVAVATIPIPLGEDAGAKAVQATVPLDLAKYGALDGAELSYEIRVQEDRGQSLNQGGDGAAQVATTGNQAGMAEQNSVAASGGASNGEAGAEEMAATAPGEVAPRSAEADSEAIAKTEGEGTVATSGTDADAMKNREEKSSESSAGGTAAAKEAGAPAENAVAKSNAGSREGSEAMTQAGSSASKSSESGTPGDDASRESAGTSKSGELAADLKKAEDKSSKSADGGAKTQAGGPRGESAPSGKEASTQKADGLAKSDRKAAARSSAGGDAKAQADTMDGKAPQDASTSKSETGAKNDGGATAENRAANSNDAGKMAADGSAKAGDANKGGEESSDTPRTATSERQGFNANGKSGDGQQVSSEKDGEDASMRENVARSQESDAGSSERSAANAKTQAEGSDAKTQAEGLAAKSQAEGAATKSQAEGSGAKTQAEGGAKSSGQQSSARQMASKDQQKASQSDSPPGDSMTRRSLDVQPPQSSNSQRMRLKVDKWAGSFSGQQRAKLEMAIGPELTALDETLAKAESTARGVLDQLQGGAAWRASHDRDVTSAEASIVDGQKIIEKLAKQTKGTPYAFIGLQVAEIGLAHVEPAREGFWKSLESDGDDRATSVADAAQHVTRARALLKDLQGQFERTKRELQLAESVEKVKKMYQVYVEDSLALLETYERDPDRYARKMAEFDLDDEYLKRLEEVLKMRRDLQAELARILSEDPRLLRRFMDALRNKSNNLREELAGLVEEQQELNREVRAWSDAEESLRPQVSRALLMRQVARSDKLAAAAGKLQEQYETWLPLHRKANDADLAAATQRIQEVATAATELNAETSRLIAQAQQAAAAPAAASPSAAEAATDQEAKTQAANPETDTAATSASESLDPLLAHGQRLYDSLNQLDVALRQIAARENDTESATFAARRLVDTRRLIADASAWMRQMKAHKAGKYTGAAEVDQYRLAMKTDELAGKLGSVERQLAATLQRQDGSLPEPIALKAREFLATLDREASPNQLAAVYALHGNIFPRATERQQAAGDALDKAEKQYDELMKLTIAELDKMPVQDPIASLLDDPTLDELLAQLEQELDLQELLGIPQRPSNLRIIGDWLRPGQGGGGGGGGMSPQAMTNQVRQQEQRARQKLDQAYKRAIARALKETQKAPKVEPPKPAKLSDWNKLVSELGEDLRQGRDKAPPEQYRRAIEQYFSTISRAVAEAEEEAK